MQVSIRTVVRISLIRVMNCHVNVRIFEFEYFRSHLIFCYEISHASLYERNLAMCQKFLQSDKPNRNGWPLLFSFCSLVLLLLLLLLVTRRSKSTNFTKSPRINY